MRSGQWSEQASCNICFGFFRRLELRRRQSWPTGRTATPGPQGSPSLGWTASSTTKSIPAAYQCTRHISGSTSASLSTINTLIHTSISVQTFLRLSQWEHIEEYQLFQWIHQSLNALQIKWHGYVHKAKHFTWEWWAFTIFHNILCI